MEKRLSPAGSVLVPTALTAGFVGLVCAWLAAVPFARADLFDALYFTPVFALTSLVVSTLYFHLQLRSLGLRGYTPAEAIAVWLLLAGSYAAVTAARLAVAPRAPRQASAALLALLFPIHFCGMFVWQVRRRAPRLTARHRGEFRLVVAFYASCIASYVAMGASVALFEGTLDSGGAAHTLSIVVFHVARVGMTALAAAVSRAMPAGSLVDWENYAVFFVSAMYQFQLRWLVVRSLGWRVLAIVGIGFATEFLQYPFRVTRLWQERVLPPLQRCQRTCQRRAAHSHVDPPLLPPGGSTPVGEAVMPLAPPPTAGPPARPCAPRAAAAPPTAHQRLLRAYHAYDLAKVASLLSFTAVYSLLSASPNREFFPLFVHVARTVSAAEWLLVAALLLAADLASRALYSACVFHRQAADPPLHARREHHELFGVAGTSAMYAAAVWHLLSVSLHSLYHVPRSPPA